MTVMTYAELKTEFEELLNRSDCTDALADQFLRDGFRRVSRKLRTAAFEQVATAVVNSQGYIEVPADLHELIGFIRVSEPRTEFAYLPHTRFQGIEPSTQRDRLLHYNRTAGIYRFQPTLNTGETIQVVYYGSGDPAFKGGVASQIMAFAPEVVKYAALIFAAIYFDMPEQQQKWAEAFTTLIAEIEDQEEMAEMAALNSSVYDTNQSAGDY